MNSLTFLEEIYPDKPDNAYLLLWKKKKSKWFKDLEEAAKYINKDKEDIYYGVGLSPKDYGINKRCKANEIIGIPGLYVDIDIGKGSKNYPPTTKDAKSLVEGHQFEPSMIVDSGYGLHVYWLFKEFWKFESDIERTYAASLSKRINYLINQKATSNGWEIDNVSDLSRILRPVGSLNCKKKPKPVSIMLNNGPRFPDPNYFDEALPVIEEYNIQPQEKISEKELANIEKIINLKITAEPPQKKLDLLLEAIPEFKELWQKIKGKNKDKTPSGFHMSLANIAAKAAWEDQEITNLLIAWNRRHKEPLEKVLDRPDYVALTIAKARKQANKFMSDKYAEELKTLSGTAFEDATKEARKKKALEILSELLGFKILGITNYPAEIKNRYRMHSAKDDIPFVGEDAMMTKSKFQNAIMAATNIALSLSVKRFERVKETYQHIIKNDEVSKEETLENRMQAWLTEYLDGRPIIDQHEAVQGKLPFVYEEKWHIYLPSFKEWAYRTQHDRDDMAKTRHDLKIIGAIHRRFNPNNPNYIEGNPKSMKRKTARPWEIPQSIAKPGA